MNNSSNNVTRTPTRVLGLILALSLMLSLLPTIPARAETENIPESYDVAPETGMPTLDEWLTTTYEDEPGVAGSSKNYGIINGFEDGTFRGNTVISKDQIVALTARTLRNEMNYKTPANLTDYLKYEDASDIADWARNDLALASMANLVLLRTDGKFVSTDEMDRGDTAIILYRMFMKIW